jgi:hypothetical protein
MCQKIRCDRESEKFCKIFWELNRALIDSVIHEVDNRVQQLKDSIFRWDELLLLEGPYV